MANNINGEKILYARGKPSVSEITNSKAANQGVLVIDPNKVVNAYGDIIDRYVKQEDLMIYCNLKVIKKSQNAVIIDEKGDKSVKSESSPVYINFLNPLRNNNGQRKDKFTTEWVDFFTSDNSNDKTSASYLIDPETFGITSINITVNANNLPIIQMTFTDIQGRMLFERGNQTDNPYNIFYTYPYPKFLLTYKGYYGSAVELQLVLLKSNTNFDPSTGNYNITAEFQADVFSLFNTFLLIYGYVAPYMFQLDDGTYLGGKILEELYNTQNKKIKDAVGEENFSKYEITSNPTLWDLSSAIKKIPTTTIKNTTETLESSTSNDKTLEIKTKLEGYDLTIRNYFNDTSKFRVSADTTPERIVYEAIDNSTILTNDLIFNEYIKELNNIINSISEIVINGATNTVLNRIITDIKKDTKINNNLVLANDKINIKTQLFYNQNDEKKYQINSYDEVLSKIYDNFSNLQLSVEDDLIEDQIESIGVSLGYEPNLSNVIRIISNNMQTFLILLELIGENSLHQLKDDQFKLKKYYKNCDYKISENSKETTFSAFPSYYKKIREVIDGKEVFKNTLTYPGVDATNAKWFEVIFVEEIYKALDVIQTKANPTQKEFHTLKKTGILTLFQLGEIDLDVYNGKNDDSKILGELLSKYNLYLPYSGLFYHGMLLDNLKTGIVEPLTNFELDLIEKNLFDKLEINLKIVIANQIAKVTSGGDGLTNLGNFAINKLGFVGKTDGVNKKLLPKLKEAVELLDTNYTKSKFDSMFASIDKTITDNIIERNLYNKITYKNIGSIYEYTTNNSKKTNPVTFNVDLKNNANFFNDNFNLLDQMVVKYKEINAQNSNTNSFQGFYVDSNVKLSELDFGTNFTNQVKFKKSSVNALTFNTKISATDENKKYYTKYNKL
jgi:ribosomal protein S20